MGRDGMWHTTRWRRACAQPVVVMLEEGGHNSGSLRAAMFAAAGDSGWKQERVQVA
jgi:hypothetical protein